MMFWGLIEPSVHKVIRWSRSEATERSEAVNASHMVCICAPCQHLKRVPQTITEPVLLKEAMKGVYGLKQCLGRGIWCLELLKLSDTLAPGCPCDIKENVIHQIRPPSSIGGPDLMLTYPLLLLSALDRGQHGHPDSSATI